MVIESQSEVYSNRKDVFLNIVTTSLDVPDRFRLPWREPLRLLQYFFYIFFWTSFNRSVFLYVKVISKVIFWIHLDVPNRILFRKYAFNNHMTATGSEPVVIYSLPLPGFEPMVVTHTAARPYSHVLDFLRRLFTLVIDSIHSILPFFLSNISNSLTLY